MTLVIQYWKHQSGKHIPYFHKNQTLWISGSHVVALFHYGKPRGAIQRHVSIANRKPFCELSEVFSFAGIYPHQIFIIEQGFQELVTKNPSHSLQTDWANFSLSLTENSFSTV